MRHQSVRLNLQRWRREGSGRGHRPHRLRGTDPAGEEPPNADGLFGASQAEIGGTDSGMLPWQKLNFSQGRNRFKNTLRRS